MSERVGELAYIIIDSLNPERLATFWGSILGLEVSERSDPYVDLAKSGDEAPVISFQRVTEPKVIKNRLHLDIRVGDLNVATEQIQTLGGRLVQECSEEPFVWRVMADPEDNEFCIVKS